MKKSLFILIFTLLAALGAKADITADWTMHMPFDAWPAQVIDTPERVYFTSNTFQYQPEISGRDFPSHSLFYYDKEGDEIVSINERTQASGNSVACIGYNFDAKYLLVVYTDCNIDFIYDDGRVFNVSGLKAASIPGKKTANSITFDITRNTAYVATSFGYVALSGYRHEVTESRNYGENIQSAGRCEDNFVLCYNDSVYYAPVTDQRFNLDEYSRIENTPPLNTILPSANGNFYAYKSGLGTNSIMFFTWDNGKYDMELCYEDANILGSQTVGGGFCVTGNVAVYHLYNNGNKTARNRPDEAFRLPATGLTSYEIWTLTDRKGLKGYKFNTTAWKWEITHDYMRPNAPATYISTALYYHPTYGMLAGSNGADLALSDFNQKTPSNISALKGGFWKEYGPAYASSMSMPNTNNYFGLAADPRNANHIYRANTLGGLMRINLANPSDVMIFANPANANSTSPGFVKVVEDQPNWNLLCRFTTPQFSTDGTMWTLYNNTISGHPELWYWPAASRLATTSAATYQPMKKISVPKLPTSNSDVMITLAKNPTIVAMAGDIPNGGSIMFYDHKGTPETTNDDKYVYMNSIHDQDGGSVSFLAVNNLYEDPSTGLVWILSQRGVFTVNPKTAFEDPSRVNRIKVARNDGTNLADYLLNEINVHSMSEDGEGRKWFSTSNGLVCTSSDGRTILAEFTTDNSYLPSNEVFATCYNPDNNSMLVATNGGLVEMFPSGSGGSSNGTGSEIRPFPNPVEPDFYGWVRIDNIADGSLVKITDSKGGLVKELGPARGGSVEWDVSGMNNRRVATGVYYIMVSPGSSGDGKAQIAKILVLN